MIAESINESTAVSIGVLVVIGTIGVWLISSITSLKRLVAELRGEVKEMRRELDGQRPRDRRVRHYEFRAWLRAFRAENPEIKVPEFDGADDEG